MKSKFIFSILTVILATICISRSGENPGTSVVQNTVTNTANTNAATTSTIIQDQVNSQDLLTKDEIYQLQKVKLLRDTQKDILEWAQTRFWIFAALFVFIGFFGVRAIVRELLSSQIGEALRSSAKAEAAAENARDTAKVATKQVGDYSEKVQELEQRATQLNDALIGAKKNLDEERKKVEANATNEIARFRLDLKALTERVSTLSSTVEQIARSSHESKTIIEKFERQLVLTKEKVSQATVRFEANSQFTVDVVTHRNEKIPLLNELYETLRKQGFKTSTSSWGEGSPPSDDIRIYHGVQAKAQAEEVKKYVEDIFAPLEHHLPVRIINKPVGGAEDPDKRIWVLVR